MKSSLCWWHWVPTPPFRYCSSILLLPSLCQPEWSWNYSCLLLSDACHNDKLFTWLFLVCWRSERASPPLAKTIKAKKKKKHIDSIAFLRRDYKCLLRCGAHKGKSVLGPGSDICCCRVDCGYNFSPFQLTSSSPWYTLKSISLNSWVFFRNASVLGDWLCVRPPLTGLRKANGEESQCCLDNFHLDVCWWVHNRLCGLAGSYNYTGSGVYCLLSCVCSKTLTCPYLSISARFHIRVFLIFEWQLVSLDFVPIFMYDCMNWCAKDLLCLMLTKVCIGLHEQIPCAGKCGVYCGRCVLCLCFSPSSSCVLLQVR